MEVAVNDDLQFDDDANENTTRQRMGTSGNDRVRFNGTNFGPLPNPSQPFEVRVTAKATEATVGALQASYPHLVAIGTSLETKELRFRSCEVVVAHATIECLTPDGVGSGFLPVASVGGLKGPVASAAIAMSFRPPTILTVDNARTPVLRLPARADGPGPDGDRTVTIAGRNFGPVGANNSVGVRASNPSLAVGSGSPLVTVDAVSRPDAASKDDDFG